MYRPGYINIDLYGSIADIICDAGDLPFESNSVDLIEACRLIEHFDSVSSRYALNEWFRVLKPGGRLIIETPDLEKSFRRLKRHEAVIYWIYGIDSPGMQHKTGFTFSTLKELLGETGFVNIVRGRPETYMYAPGLRAMCVKRESAERQAFACFRKSITQLGFDSYVLVPLEGWLRELRPDSHLRAAICNPRVPLLYLKSCIAHRLASESKVEEELDLLEYLAENEFHKKVYTLWMKSKNRDRDVFVQDLEATILEVLETGQRERLDYVLGLEPCDTEIFDFSLLQMDAKELFNLGVKHFCHGELADAVEAFLRSSRINPENPLAYWNLARLKRIAGNEAEALENYERAAELYRRDKKRGKNRTVEIEEEMKEGSIYREPIPESF